MDKGKYLDSWKEISACRGTRRVAVLGAMIFLAVATTAFVTWRLRPMPRSAVGRFTIKLEPGLGPEPVTELTVIENLAEAGTDELTPPPACVIPLFGPFLKERT
jgi:hypothetical protein